MMMPLKFNLVLSGILVLCSACVVRPPPAADISHVDYGKNTLGTSQPYYGASAQNWQTYTVRAGDNLYRIAQAFGKNISDIVLLNRLRPPYTIYPGQTLYISVQPSYTDGGISGTQSPTKSLPREPRSVVIPPTSTQNAQCYPPVQWQWPAYGSYEKILSQDGKAGILIWGRVGEAVQAAAGGKAIYSGSGYGGYPNMIIIEHNNAFSSVYAFNRKRWINENTHVITGQTIAEMGTDVNGRAVLHFEIRCHGKTLDPLSYLPR